MHTRKVSTEKVEVGLKVKKPLVSMEKCFYNTNVCVCKKDGPHYLFYAMLVVVITIICVWKNTLQFFTSSSSYGFNLSIIFIVGCCK